MAKTMQAIYQEKWASNIPLALTEVKGGKLRGFCDVASGSGMEKYTFYRERNYFAGDVAPQFFNNAGYSGTAGTKEKYSVSPRAIYAHEQVAWDEMQKSMLNADSNFMRGFGNALALKEDIEIMKAIEAAGDKVPDRTPTGGDAKVINDPLNLVGFKQNCFLAVANTDTTNVMESTGSVALIMDTVEYATLMPTGGDEGVMLSSSDFKIYQNANGVMTTRLFGCDIITYKRFTASAKTNWGSRTGVVKPGELYWIPKNTVGFVEWSGGTMSHSEYVPGNQDQYQFMVRKTVGAICIEPESIIKMVVTAS